jgi:hypothetical protein
LCIYGANERFEPGVASAATGSRACRYVTTEKWRKSHVASRRFETD